MNYYKVHNMVFANLNDARMYEYKSNLKNQGYWNKGESDIQVMRTVAPDTVVHDHFDEDLFTL